MAITDILTRIDTDASAEAGAIIAAAEAEAARLESEAAAGAARAREHSLAEAELRATEEAATLMANARLEARDALLGAKRELAEGVLERAREALEQLPDAEYLTLIADRAAESAEGATMLAIAAADAKRLAGLVENLQGRGVAIAVSTEAAPLDHGVLLTGDRVRVEVSPASIIADRRDELLLVAAQTLFGERE